MEIYIRELFKKIQNKVTTYKCLDGWGDTETEYLDNGNYFHYTQIKYWLDEYCYDTSDLSSLEYHLDELEEGEAIKRFNEIMLHHEVAHEMHDKEMIEDFDEEDFVMGKARFLAEQYSNKVDVWNNEFDKVYKLIKPLQKAFENNEITEEEAISKFKEIVVPYGFEFEILEEIDAFENFGDEFTKFVFLQGRH